MAMSTVFWGPEKIGRHMPHRSLCFDSSRTIGPLEEEDICTFGPKTVYFNSKKSLGYAYGIQLEELSTNLQGHCVERHVFSLKITGLKQDHGWNAVAVVMDKFDDNPCCNDMFRKDRSSSEQHALWIRSQFTCPWEKTLLTIVVSTMIDVYVEQIVDTDEDEKERPDPKRQKRDDSAMPYLVNKDDKHKWTDLGDGLKHCSFDGAFMEHKLPNIGIRMDGFLDNRVEIVQASKRVVNRVEMEVAKEKEMQIDNEFAAECIRDSIVVYK